MRVGILVKRLDTRGGQERFAVGVAGWLAAQGHAVHVYCQSAEVRPPGVEIHELAWGGRGRMGRMRAMARALAGVDRRGLDRVLALARVASSDVFRAGGGCHAAWMAHRSWTLADAAELRADRAAVAGADRVVVNSRMAGVQLAAHYGVAAADIRLVRNGVDLDRFRPDAGDPAPPLVGPFVLFLGSGFARKGLDTALEVVSGLAGLQLVVAGQDRHMARWTRHARRHGMENRVRFLGHVDRPERLLPHAAAVLLPTRYDSFANACLEAMACGVPVITTGRNGAAELAVEPWMVVAEPDDVPGLRTAVEQALQCRGLRDRCRVVAEAHPADAAFRKLAEIVLEPQP